MLRRMLCIKFIGHSLVPVHVVERDYKEGLGPFEVSHTNYYAIHTDIKGYRVLPTLVGSGWLQPPLSNFYHHSGLFYHHSQRVKSAEMLCLTQFDSTLAKV